MKYTFFICMLLGLLGKAQNLVQNGSFEEITACPELNSDYPMSSTWDQVTKANGWSSFLNSPDLFSPCGYVNGIFDARAPMNTFGYQNARTGNNYGGVGIWHLHK